MHVEIAADLPLLNVDGLLLEQVLVNLLENAARYTPPGTPIDITAQREGEYAVIRVADNGPGLPAGSEIRVFEKFFRGSTTPTADGRRGGARPGNLQSDHPSPWRDDNRPQSRAPLASRERGWG